MSMKKQMFAMAAMAPLLMGGAELPYTMNPPTSGRLPEPARPRPKLTVCPDLHSEPAKGQMVDHRRFDFVKDDYLITVGVVLCAGTKKALEKKAIKIQLQLQEYINSQYLGYLKEDHRFIVCAIESDHTTDKA